jgi:membrane protein YdbS with pleckstrin-like domain
MDIQYNKKDKTSRKMIYICLVLFMIYIADSLIFVLSNNTWLILAAKSLILFLGFIFMIVLLAYVKRNHYKIFISNLF